MREEDLDPATLYEFAIRDKTFKVSCCGCTSPKILFDSFALENELRYRWWAIEPGDFVVDIGSAWGSYTLTALAQGASYVIAIDPDKASYFSLASNLLLNVFTPRCLQIPFMVGKEQGLCDYYPMTHSNRENVGLCIKEKRLLVTLDSVIFSPSDCERVDWIKIDVEGMEIDVLNGGMKTLERHHPNLLIENHICFDKTIPDKIREILIPLGYKEEHYGFENSSWSLWKHEV